jgi:hypothetical protein
MSRIVIVILMHHHHKPTDRTSLLGEANGLFSAVMHSFQGSPCWVMPSLESTSDSNSVHHADTMQCTCKGTHLEMRNAHWLVKIAHGSSKSSRR